MPRPYHSMSSRNGVIGHDLSTVVNNGIHYMILGPDEKKLIVLMSLDGHYSFFH